MFIITLRFSDNKSDAPTHMAQHNAWLKRCFDDRVFILAGSLQEGLGGAVIAQGESRDQIEERVNDDPFVVHDVVKAEILEINPKQVDERLQFLLPSADTPA